VCSDDNSRQRKLGLAGNKAELVARISQHLGVARGSGGQPLQPPAARDPYAPSTNAPFVAPPSQHEGYAPSHHAHLTSPPQPPQHAAPSSVPVAAPTATDAEELGEESLRHLLGAIDEM
jgi:hypothetical protein